MTNKTEDRQAGDETEVTPEMVATGVEIVEPWSIGGFDFETTASVVGRVYRAMEAARLRSRQGT